MHISQIPDVTKVADVVISTLDAPWYEVIDYDYCISRALQKARPARIYLLVSDGEILKIGGSDDKGGIASTLRWYKKGYNGNPDDKGRTQGIPTALRSELDAGRMVEVYMKQAPIMEVQLPGLTKDSSSSTEEVAAGYKQMETLWVEQHIAIEGRAPTLNVQENGTRHPTEMLTTCTFYRDLTNKGASTSLNPRTLRRYNDDEKVELLRLIGLAIASYQPFLHPEAS